MRRFLLVAVMCGVVSGAQAADMPDLPFLRGSVSEGLSRSSVNWQGSYVGGQVSYGSVTSKVASGANSDLQATFLPPNNVSYNWLPLGSAHGNATGYGAFAGYNSQWDDVVIGFEANYIHDGFRSVQLGRAAIRSRQRHPPEHYQFECDRETLGFRLAARARRLRHGMLPTLSVRRHWPWQPNDRSHRFGVAASTARERPPPARPNWCLGIAPAPAST